MYISYQVLQISLIAVAAHGCMTAGMELSTGVAACMHGITVADQQRFV